MEKEIHVEAKRTFGTLRFYPNCPVSLMICDLLETKCVGREAIVKLANHGYKIFYKADKKSNFMEEIKAIKE